ncbi:hypothetical protein [uncultured Clostridium sp.]|uniref:hypothetical protein n=1 Tax=uncultured Clostridium sp. TaxID=59620 RepID=UPI002673A563|nr:hypothetical protein [uncultured Clostridium sp.]
MDIEVISLMEGISNNLNRVEESIVYNKQIRNNKYYRIGDKNIQISIRQKDDLLTYKAKAKRTVILVKKINETNEELLLNFIDNNRIEVLTEDYNCSEKKLKYVNILRDIENSLIIDFEVLLFFLAINDIFKSIPWNKGENTIIIGKAKEENIVAKVVMSTLKEIKHIDNSEMIELDLYGDYELSLKELAYIEDPLKEYLNYNKLRIIQRKSTHTNNYIYFMLICSG